MTFASARLKDKLWLLVLQKSCQARFLRCKNTGTMVLVLQQHQNHGSCVVTTHKSHGSCVVAAHKN